MAQKSVIKIFSKEQLAIYTSITAKCLAASELRHEVATDDIDQVMDMYRSEVEQWFGGSALN